MPYGRNFRLGGSAHWGLLRTAVRSGRPGTGEAVFLSALSIQRLREMLRYEQQREFGS